MKYDAVILAGGQSTGELKKIAPYDNEALIIIGKYPMICYVYQALRKSSYIRNIAISGPVDALRNMFSREADLLFVEGGENAIESCINAIEALKQKGLSSKLLILPTDIPLITTEAIDDFIRQSEEHEADFFYPLTSRETNEAKFPGVARTYVKLKEGTFTGGNLFIINTGIIKKIQAIAVELLKRRKNPLAMGRLFGLRLVWRHILGQLSIPAVEKRFYDVVKIKGKAIISRFAEVGVDVDKPSDLKLAQLHLIEYHF